MKFLLAFFLIQRVFATELDVVVYNLKELDSVKIKNRESTSQLYYQKKYFENIQADIVAFNEMQYDLPSVPNQSFVSDGENLTTLTNFLNIPYIDSAFALSLAGANANRNEDGEFEISTRRATLLSDSVNFGMFPGQYSLGFVSKFEIISKKEIKNVLWKDAFPERDFTGLKDSMGKDIDPNTISLFDKVMLETKVKIADKEVSIIVVHLTPQTNRGFANHINPKRNEDQLRFLKTYLEKISGPYILLGDLNADPREGTPSVAALKELLELTSSTQLKSPLPTREASGFAPSNYLIQLDYILYSKHFDLVEIKALRPLPEREELGCEEAPFNSELESDRRVVNYKSQGKTCYASVNQNYFASKIASDHFAVNARLKLRD